MYFGRHKVANFPLRHKYAGDKIQTLLETREVVAYCLWIASVQKNYSYETKT
jgi:hypothetical protein